MTVQIAVLLAFVVFISDFRKKPGMIPLVSERVTRFVKLSYIVPISIYAYVLATLERVQISDYVALGLTALGVAIAAKAKLDLGRRHTWAGYCFPETRVVTSGIYGYIRHPLYTGIFLFITGAVATILPHARPALSAAVVLALGYIVPFLVAVARRETALLSERFGVAFEEYRRQVHAFLPVRRFRSQTESC